MSRYRQWHDAYARLCRHEARAVLEPDERAWPASQGVGSGLSADERGEQAAWLLAQASRVDEARAADAGRRG